MKSKRAVFAVLTLLLLIVFPFTLSAQDDAPDPCGPGGTDALIESLSAVALLVLMPESRTLAAAGLLLLVTIWLSTFFVQVPCHRALERGFDARVHRRLVSSNWIRTAGWSLRAAVALWLL